MKVELSVISRREPRAEADNTYRDLDYSDIAKTESTNCFITHGKWITTNPPPLHRTDLTELLLEIMHCAHILQISKLRLFPKLSVGS